MNELEFLDELPADARAGTKANDYSRHAATLKLNPGRWAIINEDTYTALRAQIDRGGIKAFRPAGHFEARIIGDSVQKPGPSGALASFGKIAARYIGPPTIERSALEATVGAAIARLYLWDTQGLDSAVLAPDEREAINTRALNAFNNVADLVFPELGATS